MFHSLNMVTLSNVLLFLVISFSFSLSFTLPPIEIPHTSNLLVVTLIHDNSIDSPTYNPHATLKELSRVAYESSQARASYIKEGSSYRPTDLETAISPARGGFYGLIQFGSTRTTQKLYVDTGSSLTWINCIPCRLNVPEPLFDPAKSNTYEPEPCINSSYCQTPLGSLTTYCGSRNNNKCDYKLFYGGGENTMGHLAREDIKFFDSEEVLHKILFGCSRTTTLHTNGVLGLGNNRISLIKQSGYSRFSYCIGDLTDFSYKYNTLIIGNRIVLRGAQTPVISQNHYYINLEQIKIQGKVLDIDMHIFKYSPDDYSGGMVVDTGSTYSYFPTKELEAFEWEIIKAMNVDDEDEVQDSKMRVCYNGNINDDLSRYPTVEFVFQYNAVMQLTAQSLFHQISPDTYCLGFLSSNQINLNHALLGNWAQQNYYVAMDLEQKMLAFNKMDCRTIADKIIHDEL